MTRRACLLGWPARHSRSALIHTHWLTEYGIDGEYTVIEVPPVDFPNFLASLASSGFVGCNVTIPHKEAAFAVCTTADAACRRLRAVNLAWVDGAALHGANTDVSGFLANLDEGAPGWDRRTATALVLGAGGGARAVIGGLLDRGVTRIDVVNRNAVRAEDTCALFDGRVRPHGWDAVPRLLPDADLLCNASALGMHGNDDLHIDLSPLKSGAAVADLVYVPLRTALLRAAEARGHVTVDGLGMLLHQAVPAFERWFGVRPAVTPALRALVAHDIPPR